MVVQVHQKTMAQEMAESRKRVVTFWKQGIKKGNYVTKSLTDYHKLIHENADYARTTIEYLDIEWMFGAFAEIIAKTDKNKPQNNKPFSS